MRGGLIASREGCWRLVLRVKRQRLVCRVALLMITLARHEGREEDVGSVVGGMMKVLV